jgi:hypothetical protein
MPTTMRLPRIMAAAMTVPKYREREEPVDAGQVGQDADDQDVQAQLGDRQRAGAHAGAPGSGR